MSDTFQTETPGSLLSGPALRQLLNVCAMTHHRWVQAGKFPPPDLRINGRKYWREGTYAKWVEAQAQVEAKRRGDQNG